MARESRIHPRGAKFVAVHTWVVVAVGFNAAAVLGVLDFMDRLQPEVGGELCGSARLVDELRGVVGRDAVLKAIKQLLELDWIVEHKQTRPGKRNYETYVNYSLNTAAILDFQNQESPEALISGRPEIRPEIRTEIRTETRTETRAHLCIPKEGEAEERENRKPCSLSLEQGKVNGKTENQKSPLTEAERFSAAGILILNRRDEDAALRLEKAHGGHRVRQAVKEVERQGWRPFATEIEKFLKKHSGLHVGMDDLSKWDGVPTISTL